MPKCLIQASYTVDGVKGLLKDGGSKRRQVVEQTVRGLGGTLETFYFAFGDTDVYAIADLPDNATTAAVSLVVSSTGAVQLRTTVLLTPQDMDQATKKAVTYSPPGQ